jgi:hypothetical protein
MSSRQKKGSNRESTSPIRPGSAFRCNIFPAARRGQHGPRVIPVRSSRLRLMLPNVLKDRRGGAGSVHWDDRLRKIDDAGRMIGYISIAPSTS